jgi:hypothetical protein
MEEAARLLMSIAQGGPQRTSMLIPESNLRLLGEYLVDELKKALSVKCNGKSHSAMGQYPFLESGTLRDSVAYEIIKTNNVANGIRLGYKPHYRDDEHDYGEILEHDFDRLGPSDLLYEKRSDLEDVFGVGNFTITPEPFQMIEV